MQAHIKQQIFTIIFCSSLPQIETSLSTVTPEASLNVLNKLSHLNWDNVNFYIKILLTFCDDSTLTMCWYHHLFIMILIIVPYIFFLIVLIFIKINAWRIFCFCFNQKKMHSTELAILAFQRIAWSSKIS